MAAMMEELIRDDTRFEIPAERYLGMVVFRLKVSVCKITIRIKSSRYAYTLVLDSTAYNHLTVAIFQGTNELTESLLKRLNSSGQLHCVPASLKGKYVIRFTVTSQYTTEDDIERDWSLICMWTDKILNEEVETKIEEEEEEEVEEEEEEEEKIVIKDVDVNKNKALSDSGQRKREGLKLNRRDFGMSLVLSNVPMSPKFINGSFVALFDDKNDEILVDYAKHLGSKSFDFNGQPIRLSPRKRIREQPKQYSFDMSLIPTPRRHYMPQKQGSLDSKIEEIFDTSVESSFDDPENGSQDDDGKNMVNKIPRGVHINGHPNQNRIVHKRCVEVQTPSLSVPMYQFNGKGSPPTLNGFHNLICKQCGSTFDEEDEEHI